MSQSFNTFFVALKPIITRAPKATDKNISSLILKAIIIDSINIAEIMALSIMLL
tara:strand:- start:687 stop:848 length:162 start_codon:yes stop_codon:yes gene_type:complete